MSEKDRDPSIFSIESLVLAHLAALVKGHGASHLAFEAIENRGKGLRYRVGLAIGQLHQGDKEGGALDQSPDLRKVSLANNEVAFPVAGDRVAWPLR